MTVAVLMGSSSRSSVGGLFVMAVAIAEIMHVDGLGYPAACINSSGW